MTKILLEGRPGVGKTTVVRACIDRLIRTGTPVRGFTTSEIRVGGRRVGFQIEAVGGALGVLAHVDFPGPPSVGRYGVDLQAFERIALPTLGANDGGVVVIDELGKMELASVAFREHVREAFERDGSVLATVHRYRHPFTDQLKDRPDVRLVQVTYENRNTLADEVATWFEV